MYLHQGSEVIKLCLQLGAGAMVKAGITSLLEQFSGFFFQTGQRHLVVFQVSQKGSKSLKLGSLFSGPRLRGERGTHLPFYALHPALQLGSTLQISSPL